MQPIHVSSLVYLLPLLGLASAQCPQVHVFGARETTVSPGYGTAGSVVTSIVNSYSGATAEAITYPACGGQSSCGSVSYASSVQQGTRAVASQVNAYNTQCPNTVLVLVGYSQGGQIFDNGYCGGGDPGQGVTDTSIPISAAARTKIAAAIFMGDPRFRAGFSYNVGTCSQYGFDPRDAGFQCPYASNIQSYCDSTDPYCCQGSDANSHQQYANKYGTQALNFVKTKVNALLNGGGSSTTNSTTTTTTTSGGGGGTCSALWGQCGGTGWTGATCCSSGK
ncbi:putative acetyl xylan esterase [Auriculariales sp. MPI-PUGE-AT-0066]|nr:putative acetyl xylan esterase [Auriculariales sp. MPI-PUGE-AT-0066]